MPALITPAMRKAAPELCQERDRLRMERKPLCERRGYVEARDAEEAAALQQRITEIDTKVVALYSVAKQRLNTDVARGLQLGSTVLIVAMSHSSKIQSSMIKETQRHGKAMLQLITRQANLDTSLQEAADVMENAARDILEHNQHPPSAAFTDDDQEQAAQPEASANGNAVVEGGAGDVEGAAAESGAIDNGSLPGSFTDVPCPACGKTCNGTRGVRRTSATALGSRVPLRLAWGRRQKSRRAADAVAASRLQARILLQEKQQRAGGAGELSPRRCQLMCPTRLICWKTRLR